MTERLSKVINEWRLEHRGRHERINQFAKIALGEAPAGTPRLQNPELYFWPGLESQPFDDDTVSWMPELEAAYPVIRSELGSLLEAKVAFTPYAEGADERYRQEKFDLEGRSDRWSIYDLNEPAAESQCPKTVELLRRWFRSELGEPVTAQFSALRAGAHIPPHCGVSNMFLTAHLGLIVPQGCRIRLHLRRFLRARGMERGRFDTHCAHRTLLASGSERSRNRGARHAARTSSRACRREYGSAAGRAQ
jgi:Aspartyl/Asparaginyl beta-hydroxylase